MYLHMGVNAALKVHPAVVVTHCFEHICVGLHQLCQASTINTSYVRHEQPLGLGELKVYGGCFITDGDLLKRLGEKLAGWSETTGF